MALPLVDIQLTNGSIGGVPVSNDGVAGLIVTGPPVDGEKKIKLVDPQTVYSLTEVENLGIDAQYDIVNKTDAYKHCKDFYKQAGNGAKLWLMLVNKTTLMSAMVDGENSPAGTLLKQAKGEIRLLGITRNPPDDYNPQYQGELDKDILTAVDNAQLLASEQASNPLYSPISVFVEARDFQGNPAQAYDFRAGSNSRVSVVLGNNLPDHKGAFVGLVLGKAAAIPVQRNIGRVKDGDLKIGASYLADKNGEGYKSILEFNLGALNNLHDKGYIFARNYTGRNGFYLNDDPTATLSTDDYAYIGRRRVIDKAVRLLYYTYLNELLDDIELDPETGKMTPGVIKSYQVAGERVIVDAMLVNGEISGVNVFVDPDQNVLKFNMVKVDLGIIPKGYAKEIKITLGFVNPQNN